MRQAHVLYKDKLAGLLTETDERYEFSYFADYLHKPDAVAVSLTLPLREEVYVSDLLFPFFDGLIPEGWLLDVALRTRRDILPCTSIRLDKRNDSQSPRRRRARIDT